MIKAERLRAVMTQSELAAAAGVSSETIRKYEAGGRTPSRERLIGVLDAMHVPPSRAASVLVAAGYAPRRASSIEGGGAPAATGQTSLADRVRKAPWPRLAVDEHLCATMANPPLAALFGLEPGFALHRTRAQLNLVAMLVAPAVGPRLRNLAEGVSWAMASLKTRLARERPETAGPFADEVLAYCIEEGCVGARRLMALWEAPLAEARYPGAAMPLVLATDDGAELRLLAIETPVNGAHGPALLDWHPADAASHAYLEALVNGSRAHPDRQKAAPMRQALRP